MAHSILLRNGGIEVTILRRGAIIQSLRVPDRNGNAADIVLGFDDEQPYKARPAGRSASGKRQQLPVN
jgi:aldose 1-epimerase